MKYNILLVVIFVSTFGMLQGSVGDWSEIRFSGLRADNTSLMRYKLSPVNLTLNQVLYQGASAIEAQNPVAIGTGGDNWQFEAPVGGQTSYYGLKMRKGAGINRVVPVFYPGTAAPALSNLSLLSDDVVSDQSRNNTDIVADYVSFSDTQLITGIRNRGGGFPTSANLGTVYYSYMSIIADPASDPEDPDTIVWALNYMNVSMGGITPGLYKITGTSSSDLVRIGNISTQVVSGSNLLIMRCDLSALLADPDFAAWYDPDNPTLGFQTLTSRTTVIPFATTEEDTSPGGLVHLAKIGFDPSQNTLPQMSNLQFYSSPTELYFSGLYTDAERHFPLEAFVDTGIYGSYVMLPETNDYSQEVLFRTPNLIGELPEVTQGEFRAILSDNQINYTQSAWQDFEYVLGIRAPEDLGLIETEEGILLSWAAVTQTLLGNIVSPSYYRIERSAYPDFTEVEILGQTEQLEYLDAEHQSRHKAFYRVIAVK